MTILASNNPLPDPPARSPAALAPLRSGFLPPLCVLSQDAQLVEALRKVSADHELLAAAAEIDLSSALLAQHAGVAVIDCAALTTPVATLTAQLHAQFPDLVLIVTGNADEQGQLSARITDGTVHRFLHKPFSEQRIRLFVESAWRRQGEIRAEPRRQSAPPRGAHPRRWPRALLLVAAVALAGLAAVVLWPTGRTVAPPAPAPAPATATRAPAVTAAPESRPDELLTRAAAALQSGALIAPRGSSARELYREAGRLAPSDPRAAEGLTQLTGLLLEQANAALAAHHPEEAQRLLTEARATTATDARIAPAEAALAAYAAHAAAAPDSRAGGDAARVANYLARARDAEARGALIEPAEDNARVYLESAHAVAPDDPAVMQARGELRALLEEAARRALDSGNADQADQLATAALDAGADPARADALHEDAQQLRARQHGEALAPVVSAFNARLAAGQLLEPAGDSAKTYLGQLQQQDAGSAATQQARSAYLARVLDEAHARLKSQDPSGAQRWLAEARAAGADTAQTAALEAELGAAQAAAREASYVPETSLTRTHYVAPEFPDAARARGLDGWVELQFVVGVDGTVTELTVVAAQPAGVFEQAALDAVRRWRYQPVTRSGQTVAPHVRLRVRFTVQR
jgi:TonB family protein